MFYWWEYPYNLNLYMTSVAENAWCLTKAVNFFLCLSIGFVLYCKCSKYRSPQYGTRSGTYFIFPSKSLSIYPAKVKFGFIIMVWVAYENSFVIYVNSSHIVLYVSIEYSSSLILFMSQAYAVCYGNNFHLHMCICLVWNSYKSNLYLS